MKNFSISLVFAILTFSSFTYAQAPQAFNYQAVVHNKDGKVLSNQAISLQVSIAADAQGEDVLYEEGHVVNSNKLGLVNLKIGQGQPISGKFEEVEWGGRTKIRITENRH